MTRGRLVAAGGAIAMALIAAAVLHQIAAALGIHLNSSPSMPLGAYAFAATGFPARRGDLVHFCPPPAANAYMRRWHPEDAVNGTCAGNLGEFVKIAAGLPGDAVRIEEDGVHINGAPALPGTRVLRIAGDNSYGGYHRIVPQLGTKAMIVPRGEVWAYSPEWYSYDSRYYGPVVPAGTARMLLVYGDPPTSELPAKVEALQKKADQ